MCKTVLPFVLLTVAAFSLPIAPAQAAGATRTFLSAAGSDSNNCANVETPCRHLATAYAATAANGEIYVLDPANYGSVIITGPVSIEGHGWASIAPPSGFTAIIINANPGDKINIIGVVLDGTALTGTNGIAFNSGGSLTVRDSVVRNFGGDGILVDPDTSNPTQVFVSNTLVSDNGNDGINFSLGGTGTTVGVLNHVETVNNGGSGLTNGGNGLTITSAGGSTPTVNVTVNDSVSANNTHDGIDADPVTGAAVQIMVRNSTIANNGGNGLESNGSSATIVYVTRSTITGNNNGWADVSSGRVLSYGDNNIDGNTNVNTEPPSPLTYK